MKWSPKATSSKPPSSLNRTALNTSGHLFQRGHEVVVVNPEESDYNHVNPVRAQLGSLDVPLERCAGESMLARARANHNV